ncbi:hypothetical protein AOLI_G00160480 [Acnodon oligacanthus]
MSYNSQGFLQQDSLHFTEGPSHFISHGQLILLNQFPNPGDVIYTIPQPSGQPVVLNQFPAAEDVIYTIPPSSG